jgi:hypothetical protein
VTEDEWLACDDPLTMLEFVRGKASERKLRLFAVACYRRIWHLLEDPRIRRAVGVSELYADGKASGEELRAAVGGVGAAADDTHGDGGDAADAAADAVDIAGALAADANDSTRDAERIGQSGLLRDITGNPFRPVTADIPAWLARSGGTIINLARAIYEDRAFDRLPLLADALEDAGCTDADLLAHCRGPGPHFRGCWAVDLILGKE